ncbi:MAG: hypothetical protein WBG57_09660 [Ornithinimicrobium sp.]
MNLKRLNLPRITLVLAFLVVWLITTLLILEFPSDDGDFLIMFFGIPIVCTAGAMIADIRLPQRFAIPVVITFGLGLLSWSLWLGLGQGGVFIFPALLVFLGAALMVRRRNQQIAHDEAARLRRQNDPPSD